LAGNKLIPMILAKKDGTTLEEHIDDCLRILFSLNEKISILEDISELSNFRELLILAILFHDFGKIHHEFQKLLRNEDNNWHSQRHEIFSVMFSNKLDLPDEFLILIKKIILAHHKSFDYFKQHYMSKEELTSELFYIQNQNNSKNFHPKDIFATIKQIPLCDINKTLNFIIKKITENKIKINFKKVIIDEINNPIEEIVFKKEGLIFKSKIYFQNLFLLGTLKICDHYGSAGIKYLPILNIKHFQFLNKINEPYNHQMESWNTTNNTILIAPTGSGKTECALGWLKNQILEQNSQVYYILPFTASINAMHKRLTNDLENNKPEDAEIVGINHGKLTQYLANLEEYSSENYTKLYKKKDLYKKLVHPIKIVTPFQILKFFFGIKGFEMGLTNLAGAKLIFDEIHAYDIITYAQINVILENLIKFFKCKVFIMTATMPTFLLNELAATIPKLKIIKTEDIFNQKLKRHIIKIYDDNIMNIIEANISKFKNKRVMIVTNTIKKSQECFNYIKSKFPSEKTCLIHSRFTGKDRMKNEAKAYDFNTKFLIGTQAIEVSLDIDYDMMITEIAPIDALLQRFGRVNRKANKPPCEVFICEQSSGINTIYEKELCDKTLEVLKKVDILNEAMIQNLVDEVYNEWNEKDKIIFSDIKKLFENSLNSLNPFFEHKDKEEDFYSKFDNINILPAKFYNDYKQAFERLDFIKADNYIISIGSKLFHSLKINNKIEIKECIYTKNDQLKSEKIFVCKCKYDNEVGLLLDEHEEISGISFL